MPKTMLETRWYELGLALENLANDIYQINSAAYNDFWPEIDEIIKEMSEILFYSSDFDKKYQSFMDFVLNKM